MSEAPPRKISAQQNVVFTRSFVNSIEKNDANVKISESKSKN